MRILIANPNTDATLTRRLVRIASTCIGPGIDVVGATAPVGVVAIETAAQVEAAAQNASALFDSTTERLDAALLACFADPGLRSRQALNPFPVLGMVEASLLAALMVAERVAVVTVSTGALPLLKTLITSYDLASRVGSLAALGIGFGEIGPDPEQWIALLTKVVRQAAKEADAVVVGGAFLAGLGDLVEADVPVFDSFTSSVRQAEMAARCLAVRSVTGAASVEAARTPARPGTGA